MRISIVIPVYNEERNIVDCLETIVAQTIPPDEVIVVDNNCTDRTVALASQYPFVRIVKENKQGRGHARSKGFNEATSEIIGRIDADSRLAPDWVERVKSRFEADDTLMGLTGIGLTSFIPGIHLLRTTLFTRGYFWYVHAGFRCITMWGANMAIKSSIWKEVSSKVCNDDSKVHEDQDISMCIVRSGGKIMQDNDLKIIADGQAFISISKALHYRKLYQQTKKLHRKNGNIQVGVREHTNIVEYLLGLVTLYIIGGFLLILGLVLWPLFHLIKRLSIIH